MRSITDRLGHSQSIKNMKKMMKEMAKRQGVSVNTFRREIVTTIDITWHNVNESAAKMRSCFKNIKPSPEEFLLYMSVIVITKWGD